MIYAICHSNGYNFEVGQKINSNYKIHAYLNGSFFSLSFYDGRFGLPKKNNKYLIVEFPEDGYSINDGACLLENATVLFVGTAKQLAKTDYVNKINFDSKGAYWWAENIGNKDILINKITESKWAFAWAINIGNHDIMIDRITESRDAYAWAVNIGNRDVMIDRITDSEYAFLWARKFGDRDVMISRITDSQYAFLWARNFHDYDIMIEKVVESEWAYKWANEIGNKDVMINRVTESEYAYEWAENIGDYDIMIPKIEHSGMAIWLSQNKKLSSHHIDALFKKMKTTSDILEWNRLNKDQERCKDAIIKVLEKDGILPENIIDILTWNENNPQFEIEYNFSIKKKN